MNDEKLIELVRVYPVVYDLCHPKYMDNSLKMDIWNKIGEEMGADGGACKTRWNNIRDNYRKSLKKAKSGQSSKVKSYKYSEQLTFLRKYLNERKTKSSILGDSQLQENDIVDVILQENEEMEVNVPDESEELASTKYSDTDKSQFSSSEYESGFTRKRKISTPTRKETVKQIIPDRLMEYSIRKDERPATSTHPVDAFLAGIAPTLKSLNPYYLNLAKSEIFASVQKYEMKMLEHHSEEAISGSFSHDS